MFATSGLSINRDHDDEQLTDVVHELGNVSLLIDAALRLTGPDDQMSRLLFDARRRIDELGAHLTAGDTTSL